MISHRWTDTFLNQMRQQGDPLADECLRTLMRDNELRNIQRVFAEMDSNNEVPPSTTFPELSEFFKTTNSIPSYVDTTRISRGESVFQKNAFTGALVLQAAKGFAGTTPQSDDMTMVVIRRT